MIDNIECRWCGSIKAGFGCKGGAVECRESHSTSWPHHAPHTLMDGHGPQPTCATPTIALPTKLAAARRALKKYPTLKLCVIICIETKRATTKS